MSSGSIPLYIWHIADMLSELVAYDVSSRHDATSCGEIKKYTTRTSDHEKHVSLSILDCKCRTFSWQIKKKHAHTLCWRGWISSLSVATQHLFHSLQITEDGFQNTKVDMQRKNSWFLVAAQTCFNAQILIQLQPCYNHKVAAAGTELETVNLLSMQNQFSFPNCRQKVQHLLDQKNRSEQIFRNIYSERVFLDLLETSQELRDRLFAKTSRPRIIGWVLLERDFIKCYIPVE